VILGAKEGMDRLRPRQGRCLLTQIFVLYI